MPWNVNHSTVEGLCPGMLVHLKLLRGYALGCFNHPKLLRAHALECLVIQTRKIVPHAYCISSCRRCIVVVVVVGVVVVDGVVVAIVDAFIN